MKFSLLKTYLLLATAFSLAGLVIFYSSLHKGLAEAKNLTSEETVVLTMLDNLDMLNSALILIEKNENSVLLNANHNSSLEVKRSYAIADSALYEIKSLSNSQFFKNNDIDGLVTLFRRKIDISKQVIQLSEAGDIKRALKVLKAERDDDLVVIYLHKYNDLFATGRQYVLDFQKGHIYSSARDFTIVKGYCLLVLCGLLFVVWQSLRNLNRQEKLIDENNTYRNIIESSQSLVTITDENFELSYCNPSTESLLGISKLEMIGKNPESYFRPASETLSLAAWVNNAKSTGTWSGELIATGAAGNIIYLSSNVNALYNHKNELKGCFAVHSNITPLKLAQEKAQKLTEQLTDLNNDLNKRVQEQATFITEVFSRIEEDFIGTDNNLIITYINRGRFFKDQKIILKETSLLSVLENITSEQNINIFKNALATQQSTNLEFSPSGSNSWFKANIYPTVTGLSVFFADVTKDKKAAFELGRLNKLYQFTSLLNETILRAVSETAIFAGICTIASRFENIIFTVVSLYDEEQDKIIPIQWSGSGSDYVKYIVGIKPHSPETGSGPIGYVVRTGNYWYFNDIENAEGFAPWRSHAVHRGFKSSIALPIKKNGRLYAILGIYAGVKQFFQDEELKIVLRVMDNINYALQNIEEKKERKKAENKLQLVSSAIDQSLSPVIITDTQRNIVYANLAFCLRAGLPLDKVTGRSIRDVRPLIPGGNSAPVNLDDILYTKHHWKGVFLSKDNEGVDAWELVSISAIKDHEGLITHFSAISEDITERKKLEIEEKALTINLMQSNRSLKQFSYALSHYIRAPLSNILAFEALFKEEMPPEEQKVAVGYMIQSAKQIDAVIKDITPILHQQQASADRLEEIYFEDIMAKISSNLSYMIEQKNALIKTNFEKARFVVTIRQYIKSIFTNIIINAMQYAKAGSNPVLEIWTEKLNSNTLIHFKDYGQGINLDKYKNEVFGLYKRFNFSVPGKGLGLFSVKAQVEYLGGNITVNSLVNEWTEFVVALPDLIL